MKKILFLCTFLCSVLPARADFEAGEAFFEQQNYSSALMEFLPLANSGDFRSQYYVGYLYLNGLGVTQNVKEGLKYLQKSLDQNYDMAQSLMGFLYEEGHILPQDKKKAVELYYKASAQNNASANLNLGVMYYNGNHVDQDTSIALEYFKKVPLDEKPIVARYLGEIYLNNPDFRDYAGALQHYRYAAKEGDLDSFFALGEIYRKGTGVAKSISSAMPYYHYAASKGYAPAQYMLGIIYANGDGVSRDVPKGYAWLSLAAEQHFTNAQTALDQLSGSMSLYDFDQARREIFLIQENELGKVEMPPIYVSNIDSAASVGTAKPKARKRRRGIRSRRN
ncbi:MAG: sel1 repeat family protein [Alphaproteobacteria bacterium]|nr:sel1 repeat family protein [Alphaproteobacteria bacterium]